MKTRMLCLFGLLAVLVAALQPVQAALPAESPQPASFTLADLGEKDLVVKSIYDQVLVHFPLAEGMKIEHAVLNLHFSHSRKLLPENSDLTIALNDEPAANLPLTSDNSSETK